MNNSKRIDALEEQIDGWCAEFRRRLSDLDERMINRIRNLEYELGGVVAHLDDGAPIPEVYEEAEPITTEYEASLVDDIAFDATNPDYYKLPNGTEAIDTSEWLSSNGGQAVQYIVRATRIDGVTKTYPLEDLRKARWFIDREISRMEQHASD